MLSPDVLAGKPVTYSHIEDALPEIVANVRTLAERYPNAVYLKPEDSDMCHYDKGRYAGDAYPTDMCGCIVGVAAGMVNPGFQQKLAVIGSGIDDILSGNDYVDWLRDVQQQQDRYVPWGEAVIMADLNPPLTQVDSEFCDGCDDKVETVN